MLRHISLAAAAIVMLTAPAAAQNVVIQPHPGLPSDAPSDIRVNVSMSFFVAAPMNDAQAAAKAQEQARRVIYESAGRECDLLRAVKGAGQGSQAQSGGRHDQLQARREGQPAQAYGDNRRCCEQQGENQGGEGRPRGKSLKAHDGSRNDAAT